MLTKVGTEYVYTSGSFEEDNMVLLLEENNAGVADDEFHFFNSPAVDLQPAARRLQSLRQRPVAVRARPSARSRASAG